MAVLPLKPREVPVPLPGQAISVVLSLAATTVLTNFLTQRALAIKIWRRLPLVVWLVFAIYTDSYLFVSATAILQHTFGVNSSLSVCRGAILLCLVCYVSTKIFIYLFLVEKAHIIRGTPKRRLQSKLYIFNSFGMLGVYIVVVILNFVFRITRMQNGQCIIGMKSVAMIPLISFDAVVNVYLTIMFLIPLKNLYSFKNMPRTQANIRLRTVAFRTFVGALCTLLSSIINLSVLMALDGEPGWVCLMCCNCDILFSAMVIQWVTSKDNAGTSSATSSGGTGRAGRVPAPGQNRDSGGSTIHSFPLRQTHHSAPTTPGDYFLGSRRSGSQSDVADQHDSTDHSIKHDANGSRAVIVTTTIKRESVLASDDDLQSLERSFDSSADDGEAKPIRAGMHRASGASVWPEAMFGPRTTVAAGTSSSPTKPHISRSYFDARAEPFAKGQDR